MSKTQSQIETMLRTKCEAQEWFDSLKPGVEFKGMMPAAAEFGYADRDSLEYKLFLLFAGELLDGVNVFFEPIDYINGGPVIIKAVRPKGGK